MDNRHTHQPQLAQLREIVVYDLQDGGGFRLREARDAIPELSAPGDVALLHALDEAVVSDVLEGAELMDSVFADDDRQPLAKWWWHLGKIRDKTFPVEVLPTHLQAVYAGSLIS